MIKRLHILKEQTAEKNLKNFLTKTKFKMAAKTKKTFFLTVLVV
jgi:hypothetical protein